MTEQEQTRVSRRRRPIGSKKESIFYVDGDKIYDKREELDITQVELANKAGVSKSTVSLAEKGKRLSKITAGRIAEALGTEVDDLLLTNPVDSSPLVKAVDALQDIAFNLDLESMDPQVLLSSIQSTQAVLSRMINSLSRNLSKK